MKNTCNLYTYYILYLEKKRREYIRKNLDLVNLSEK
jgi:hypothetical protein